MPMTLKCGLALKAVAWCMPRLPIPTTITGYWFIIEKPNDESRMTKSERNPKAEFRSHPRLSIFELNHSFVMRHSDLTLPLVPFHRFGDHAVHFLLGQFGKHWQRNAGVRVLLG